jgi:hypothetical protein
MQSARRGVGWEWPQLRGRRTCADSVSIATRLDLLSRSVQHLINLGADLRPAGIGLRVIEQGIDTATIEGCAMFGMLSVLAELQRGLIVANTRDGLAAASARGSRTLAGSDGEWSWSSCDPCTRRARQHAAGRTAPLCAFPTLARPIRLCRCTIPRQGANPDALAKESTSAYD